MGGLLMDDYFDDPEYIENMNNLQQQDYDYYGSLWEEEDDR